MATIQSYIHEFWSKCKEASELTYKGKGGQNQGGLGQSGQSLNLRKGGRKIPSFGSGCWKNSWSGWQ